MTPPIVNDPFAAEPLGLTEVAYAGGLQLPSLLAALTEGVLAVSALRGRSSREKAWAVHLISVPLHGKELVQWSA